MFIGVEEYAGSISVARGGHVNHSLACGEGASGDTALDGAAGRGGVRRQEQR